MGRVILDTSFVIAAMQANHPNHPQARTAITAKNNDYFASVVTYSEILVGAFALEKGDSYKRSLSELFSELVPVDVEIATVAAELRYQSKKSIRLPDSLIAATAKSLRAELWTFDVALSQALPTQSILYPSTNSK